MNWATILFLKNFCHRERGEKRAFLGESSEEKLTKDRDRAQTRITEVKSVPVRESLWQKSTEQSFVLPYHMFILVFCSMA